VKLAINVYQCGYAKSLQIAIEDDIGGFRLAGPKFDGNSRLLKAAEIDARAASEIRHYLDRHFPVAPPSIQDRSNKE
jgi:hypothetical protein